MVLPHLAEYLLSTGSFSRLSETSLGRVLISSTISSLIASPASSIQPSLLRIQSLTKKYALLLLWFGHQEKPFISWPIFFLIFYTLGHCLLNFSHLHLLPLQSFFFLAAAAGSSIISTASTPVLLTQLSIAALSLAPIPVPNVQARVTSPSLKYSKSSIRLITLVNNNFRSTYF